MDCLLPHFRCLAQSWEEKLDRSLSLLRRWLSSLPILAKTLCSRKPRLVVCAHMRVCVCASVRMCMSGLTSLRNLWVSAIISVSLISDKGGIFTSLLAFLSREWVQRLLLSFQNQLSFLLFSWDQEGETPPSSVVSLIPLLLYIMHPASPRPLPSEIQQEQDLPLPHSPYDNLEPR